MQYSLHSNILYCHKKKVEMLVLATKCLDPAFVCILHFITA